MHLVQLYNHRYIQDRRQSTSNVAIERRTQPDRRTSPRLQIDTKIKNDMQMAKKIFNQVSSDTFVRSTDSVNVSKQAEKVAPTSNIAFTALNKIVKASQSNGVNGSKTTEAAIGAVGAGLGLALPLFAGMSSPLMLAGFTAIGAVSGVFFANRAVDLYNYRNK